MSLRTAPTKAAEIRARLGHPIVDVDGHLAEFQPALDEFLRDELGAANFERLRRTTGKGGRGKSGADPLPALRDKHRAIGPWFPLAPGSQTLDLASEYLPRLLAERLDDLGFDYTILYGSFAIFYMHLADDDLRRGGCRAYNRYLAEYYGEVSDRLTAAAAIPMDTPEEAVAEIEHVKSLGLKVLMLPTGVRRPVPAIHRKYPELFPRVHWWDTYGVESAHDYDPVWNACRDLGFAPTFHGAAAIAGWTTTTATVTNFTFNHIGSFAYLMHNVCKSLVLGGVTRRFPDLTFGFLECGVAWACTLLADLIEHWEKRQLSVMEKRRPQELDVATFRRLHDQWGGRLTAGRFSDAWLEDVLFDDSPPRDYWDDFRAMEIRDKADFYDRFVPNLYFGCEPDDRTLAFGFSEKNAFGATLKSMISSDIGHWDVIDMEDVLPDAYGLVEKGLLTPEQFRAFTFENPAALHLRMNPEFFAGTRLAAETAHLTGRSG